ncbi:hypothetical protein CLV63_112102 [Murinocardiopsis flavida]|uniref:Endonuclease/exonuclease/phosphatase family metal-dependent hydrolase n=1 Tax=Murinocardiopsis flavida TaxID=645275 RepID=A0A2P8DG82_9ACTN|nr:endonuclease/exonuclease/phosphatase family protein [Murinocardiopsis flavida]PSK96220.1 hypothetical protein CLV63_112102 [Murinocardiopsis flavida]
MLLRVLSQNLAYGGTADSEGRPDGRWDPLMAAIAAHAPHVLCAQELARWEDHSHQRLAAAEHALGLRVLGGITPSRSANPTAVMYRPGPLRWTQWETRYARELHHGLGVGVLEVDKMALPLTVISAHLTPYSANQAAIEAQIVAARAWRYQGAGIVAGDINHFPLDDQAPASESIPRYNRSSRWTRDASGDWVPNRIVGEKLHAGGLTDAALHLSRHRGDPDLLAPTAGKVRVDQAHLTPALLPALVDYTVLDHGHSDHAGILITLDTDLIDTAAAQPDWI